ncbi:MAG: hypothetical protein L0215_05840 [Gemmataceae bacterium]|nr:hypothetical protein [Gemmataceae bacterium]
MRHATWVVVLALIGPSAAAGQTPRQKLYITNSAGNDVTIVDVATHKVIKSVEVGPRPHGIAVPAKGDFILVTIEGGKQGELVWIDPVKDVVTRRLSIGPAPNQLAVTPDGNFAYVPVSDGHYEVIDTKKGAILERIKTGGRPHNALCSADGRLAFLAPMGPINKVTVVEVAGHKVVGAIPFSNVVRPIALSKDARWLFAEVDGLVGFEMADVASRKMVERVEAELKPQAKKIASRSHGIEVRPDQKEVWICDVEHKEAQVFDITGAKPKQVAAIAMPGGVYWITFSPDGRYGYVSVRTQNQVAVVDTSSRQIVTLISTGKEPKRLLVVTSPD